VEKAVWLAAGKKLDDRWSRAQFVIVGTGIGYGELARMKADAKQFAPE
jgi:hypothetical protein